jgi:hypothetical protein
LFLESKMFIEDAGVVIADYENVHPSQVAPGDDAVEERCSYAPTTSEWRDPEIADVNPGRTFPTRIVLIIGDEADEVIALILRNQDVQSWVGSEDITCQRRIIEAREVLRALR